jgi:hypothetical protein
MNSIYDSTPLRPSEEKLFKQPLDVWLKHNNFTREEMERRAIEHRIGEIDFTEMMNKEDFEDFLFGVGLIGGEAVY